jgi:hypothetical protein
MAFKFGKTGRESKPGCIKARYSISARFPASGQIRISRSGRFTEGVVPRPGVADMFVEINDEQRRG